MCTSRCLRCHTRRCSTHTTCMIPRLPPNESRHALPPVYPIRLPRRAHAPLDSPPNPPLPNTAEQPPVPVTIVRSRCLPRPQCGCGHQFACAHRQLLIAPFCSTSCSFAVSSDSPPFLICANSAAFLQTDTVGLLTSVYATCHFSIAHFLLPVRGAAI